MSHRRLLDRQISLIEHLTNPRLYRAGSGALHPDLAGLDVRRLALLGRLSLAKRMEKIEAVLAKTFAHLDADLDALAVRFAEEHPPASATRYDNALQFHRFLCRMWRDAPPAPAYVGDLAAFEIAFARVRFFAARGSSTGDGGGAGPAVRRRRDVELLCCAFDVRPLFDDTVDAVTPARRETRLAIGCPDPASGPRVFEIGAEIHRLLQALDDWRPLHDMGADRDGGAAAVLGALAERGLVEVRR